MFGRGSGGFGGWSVAKAALDQRITETRTKAGADDMPHWTVHDLCRSFSTRANELGLGPPWMIEAVLNHVVGDVHGTYNRAQHETGKREVLEAWGAYVGALVSKQHTATRGKPKQSAPRHAKVTAA